MEVFTPRCFLCNEQVRKPIECPNCEVAHYCSRQHLKIDRDQHQGHSTETCRRMKSSMAASTTLYSNIPFTWYPKQGLPSRCTLLKELGVHRKGAWVKECHCTQGKAFGLAAPLLRSLWKNTSRGIDVQLDRATLLQGLDDYSWWAGAAAEGKQLLTTSLSTTSCSSSSGSIDAASGIGAGEPEINIDSWESYCIHRQVPLTSPLPILLDMPLTVYWAVQKLKKQRGGSLPRKITICIAGPEKEVDQWPVFLEIGALLPENDIILHFVGPEIPSWADNCSVTVPHVGSSCHTKMHFHAHVLNYVLHARLEHSSIPNIIVGLNAGLGAYQTWLTSLGFAMQLMQTKGMPELMLFTDYISESIWIAKQNCNMMLGHINRGTGRGVTLSESEINPFRKPVWIKQAGHSMPYCPNGFGFWIECK